MYLRHLSDSRGLAVYDARSGALAFWIGEGHVRELIQQGKVQPKGPRRRPARLEWVGPPLTAMWRFGERPEDRGGGHDIREKTHYSHDRETKTNPVNVWALIYLGNDQDSIFLEVASDCGATLIQRERKAVKCEPCKGSGAINPTRFGRLSVCRDCGGSGKVIRYQETLVNPSETKAA